MIRRIAILPIFLLPLLTSDVALLADLPITRAIMTGSDPFTIQDASQGISQIAASDLFVLIDRSGTVRTVLRDYSPESEQLYLRQLRALLNE